MKKTRLERIAAEKIELGIKPWQFCPSEIRDGPNPFADSPGTGACVAWDEAQRWRATIRERDPDYFADDPQLVSWADPACGAVNEE